MLRFYCNVFMPVMALFFILAGLQGCAALQIPEDYHYREIITSTFRLATWQKISNKSTPVRIYVEGDGYAFDRKGNPTDNPTPISTIVRELAFNDPHDNVVYTARPCQFIQTKLCTKECWSVGRFSAEAVRALYEASREISQGRGIVYIGYSGGAMLTGLVIQEYPDLPVKKWITLAGLLDHEAWTKKYHLYPLTNSLNLQKLPDIPQVHFIGDRDRVIPLQFMKEAAKGKRLYIISNASHNENLSQAFEDIYKE